ncbi:MAG: tRNA lysidine(34) synthetase TilS [Acetivibrionales bacterium]|jgi:tRNA(Ile)-lysidine synthase
MENSLLNKVRKDIEDNNLLNPGSKVVIGVSGGADSVCLLKVLIELRQEYDLKLFVVHVNHGLRGIEADKDQAYVMEICRDWGINAKACFVNIKNLSKKLGVSEEEAGREARYRVFSKVLDNLSYDYIAVAHNRDDRAETVMLNIIRGAGLDGLCGMPIKQGRIIRPLFNVSRSEIEEYLKLNNIPYCIDSTNNENEYTRNRIRNMLFPKIKEWFDADPANQLIRLSELVIPERNYLDKETKKYYNIALIKEALSGSDNDEIIFSAQSLASLSIAISKRIIRLAWERINGDRKNLEAVHVDQILSLCLNSRTGKNVSLPNGIDAIISYERLIFSRRVKKKVKSFSYSIDKEGITEVIEIGGALKSRVIDQKEYRKLCADKKNSERDLTQFFDLDLINGEILIRSRLDGDRIRPYNSAGEKKLKDFFIDQKVPRDQRTVIPLIAQGQRIAWIIGMRTSEDFRAREDSKRIWMLSWSFSDNGGEEDA